MDAGCALGNHCFGNWGGTGHTGSRSLLGQPANPGGSWDVRSTRRSFGWDLWVRNAGSGSERSMTRNHHPAACPCSGAISDLERGSTLHSLWYLQTFLPGPQLSTCSHSPGPDDEVQTQPVGHSPPQLGPGLSCFVDRLRAGVSRSLASLMSCSL